MENMAKLKPCPFCGTPPSLEYEMVYPHDLYTRVFGVRWEVICPHCGTKRSGGCRRNRATEGNYIPR